MSFFRSSCAAAFLAVALAASATAAGAEAQFPRGLRVGLEPPADTRLSTHFNGFEDTARKVAIKILDLPANAYQTLEKGFFADAKKGAGVTDEKRESFPFNDGTGFLVTFKQATDGVSLNRWVMIAQSSSPKPPSLAMLIDVKVPEAASAIYSDAVIRAALKSVTFRPAPIDEQLSMMPFELNALAGFRVVRVLPTGAVMLTDGPNDQVGEQPYMMVMVGTGAPANVKNRGEFSRQLLMGAPLAGLTITSGEGIRVHNTPVIEFRADAKGADGKPLSVIQWVRFGGGAGYLRVVGVVRKDDWEKFFPRFRQVRDGVAPRKH